MVSKAKKAAADASISADPEQTLHSLARRVVMEFTDPVHAREALADSVRAMPELYDSLRARLEETAFASAIYSARHQILHKIKTGAPQNKSPRGLAAMASVARVIEEAMLDWTFPSGKVLKEMKGAELDPEIEREHQQVEGHRKNEEFFRAIRKRTDDDEIVRDKVTPAEARAMWRRISGK